MSSAITPYRDCCFCFGPSCTLSGAKASKRWDRIVTHKMHESGNSYESNGRPLEKIYMLDRTNGDLYPGEGPEDEIEGPDVVSTKCFALLIGTPLYTLGCLTYRGLKSLYDIVDVSIRTLKQTAEDWKRQGCLEAVKTLIKGFLWHLPGAILYNLKEAVRDVFFGALVWLSALEGVFSPFAGRSHIAKLEFKWHHEVSYKEDPRYKTDLKKWNALSPIEQMKIIWNSKAIYLAFCMQSRGNLYNLDSRVKYDRSLPIKAAFPEIPVS